MRNGWKVTKIHKKQKHFQKEVDLGVNSEVKFLEFELLSQEKSDFNGSDKLLCFIFILLHSFRKPGLKA
jgi:hypothetical protein